MGLRFSSTPRTALLCAGLSLAFGASACGGQSDEDAIKDVAADYLASIVSGDGPGACRNMTEAGRQALIATTTPATDELEEPPTDCQSAVTAFYKTSLAAGNELPLSNEIADQVRKDGSVKIDGDTATLSLPGDNTAQPTLKKVAGEWKIDDLGNGAG
ncbi:hypothetical protein [Patulibacter defluvii]|uniref:hypothetical protein n=1 Tax=Patulibacter defluvii TaxID=3095358 RepID=UPI002A74BD64|nr:hypothetical protein [Patulibacter sp. DM4]